MDISTKHKVESQYETILHILSECTEDYIYIYDLNNDFFRISSGALEFYDLPSTRFYNATEYILNAVHPDDKALLITDLNLIKEGKSVTHDLEYRWLDKQGKSSWIRE